MTQADIIAAWIEQADKHAQSSSLASVATTGEHGAGRALLSYGVPVAMAVGGSVFVDCFSDWSATTNKHQHAAYRAAQESSKVVHAVDWDTIKRVSGSMSSRTPNRRAKRIGATL